MGRTYTGRGPKRVYLTDEWLDEVECTRILEGMDIVETFDIRLQVFPRQYSAEWYPAECKALKELQ